MYALDALDRLYLIIEELEGVWLVVDLDDSWRLEQLRALQRLLQKGGEIGLNQRRRNNSWLPQRHQ